MPTRNSKPASSACWLLLLVFGFGQQLMLLQAGHGGVAGIQHDVAGKIQHLLQRPGADVQQACPCGTGNALEIPDMAIPGAASSMWPMRSRRTLALGDLHAALIADHALEAGALVLAAVALPVLGGPEDALAEQAVALRLQGAIVDGFRLGNLAVRPLREFFPATPDRFEWNPDLSIQTRSSLPSTIEDRRRVPARQRRATPYPPQCVAIRNHRPASDRRRQNSRSSKSKSSADGLVFLGKRLRA